MKSPTRRIAWLVTWLLVMSTIAVAQTRFYQIEGTIDSLDKATGVMDVGSTKGIRIAAGTKILRAGAPASLADLATGQVVSVRVFESQTWLQVGSTRQESFTRRAVDIDVRRGVAPPVETGGPESPGSRPAVARGEPPVFWYSSFAVYTQEGMLKEVNLAARKPVGSEPLPGVAASIAVPDQGVEFGPNVKSAHGILVEAGDAKIACGQVSQDVAYVLDGAGNRRSQLPLLGFEGCPLVVEQDLEPAAGMEARERNEIVIEEANGPLLQVTGSRFFATDGKKLVGGCEMLPNTVWVFRKKGLAFETRSHRFSVEQDGATITFTRTGVVLTGVRRVKR